MRPAVPCADAFPCAALFRATVLAAVPPARLIACRNRASANWESRRLAGAIGFSLRLRIALRYSASPLTTCKGLCATAQTESRTGIRLLDMFHEPPPLPAIHRQVQPHPVKPAGFPAHGVMQSTLEPKPPRIKVDPHLHHHLIWHAAFVVIERVDFLAVFKHKRIAVTSLSIPYSFPAAKSDTTIEPELLAPGRHAARIAP